MRLKEGKAARSCEIGLSCSNSEPATCMPFICAQSTVAEPCPCLHESVWSRSLAKCRRGNAQVLLSACWHGDAQRVSVLSRARASDTTSPEHQFSVHNVRSGECETVYNTTCPPQGTWKVRCFWSPSGTRCVIASPVNPTDRWLYDIVPQTKVRLSRPAHMASQTEASKVKYVWAPGSTRLAAIGQDILIFDAGTGTAVFRVQPPQGSHRSWAQSHIDCWADDSTFYTWVPAASGSRGERSFDLHTVSMKASPPRLEIACPIATNKIFNSALHLAKEFSCQAIIASKHGSIVLMEVADNRTGLGPIACLASLDTGIITPLWGSWDPHKSVQNSLARCFSPCGRFFALADHGDAGAVLYIFDTDVVPLEAVVLIQPITHFLNFVWAEDCSAVSIQGLGYSDDGEQMHSYGTIFRFAAD